MRDRAGAGPALPARPRSISPTSRATPGIDVPVAAAVDRVVEEQVAAGPHERAPAFEVRLRALVRVVAVDEQQLELVRAGARPSASRRRRDAPCAGGRSARARRPSSASSWSPGMSGRSATCRSYDHSSTPFGSADANVNVLPPLNRPISTNGPLVASRARRYSSAASSICSDATPWFSWFDEKRNARSSKPRTSGGH